LEGPDHEELPEKYRDLGWKYWLRNTYSKVWFLVIAFFLDAVIAFEISAFLGGIEGVALSLVCLSILIVGETYLYHLWWGGLDFLFGPRRFL